jgi:drug/metabolite transporter (DMT)-like permease
MPPPSAFAILLLLSAALLHAVWNAIVKGSSDRGVTIGLVATGNAMVGVLALAFVPVPAAESWIFIALTVAIHLFYFSFLILAYRLGDFSQVYPIARGIAPFLVAVGAMVFAGEFLSAGGWAGLILISLAISLLVFARSRVPVDRIAIGAALLTGVCIAAYTIVDGMGVRTSGAPLGYIAWAFSMKLSLGIGFLFWRRSALAGFGLKHYAAGIGGGVISGTAYGLAVYAMSVTTLGSVSAIRESSVIMAALIGVIWFGERPWLPRLLASTMVVAGVLLLAAG